MTKPFLLFGELPDEEEKPPVVGIYQQLYDLEKQKRMEKERQKNLPTDVEEPVDKDLLITPEPTSLSEAPLPSEAHSLSKGHSPSEDRLTASQSKGHSLSEGRSINDHDGGLVRISNNYCFLDRDILRLFKDLKEAELRIYLDLLTRTWLRHIPKNICTCSNREITETTGISSSASFAKVFKALEAKNLIKRLLISRSINEKTLFRVFLPCEREGSKSNTQVQYVQEDDDLH